jgi:hypothetical protein
MNLGDGGWAAFGLEQQDAGGPALHLKMKLGVGGLSFSTSSSMTLEALRHI